MPKTKKFPLSRRDQILQYIIENDGPTNTDVIKFMKGKAALATTHNLLKSMIDDKVIISKKDVNNSQKHHLYPNDKNDFTLIYSELDSLMNALEKVVNIKHRLERLIRWMDDPVKKLINSDQEKTKRATIDDYLTFSFWCKESFNTMLEILLLRVMQKIRSEKYSYILNAKIVQLMIFVIETYYGSIFAPNELNDMIPFILKQRPKLPSKDGPDQFISYDESINSVVNRLEVFAEKFCQHNEKVVDPVY